MKAMYKHLILLLFGLLCGSIVKANTVTYEMYNNQGVKVAVVISTVRQTVNVRNGYAEIPITVNRNDVVGKGFVSFRLSKNGRNGDMACVILKSGNGYYLKGEYIKMYHGLEDGVYNVYLLPQIQY